MGMLLVPSSSSSSSSSPSASVPPCFDAVHHVIVFHPYLCLTTTLSFLAFFIISSFTLSSFFKKSLPSFFIVPSSLSSSSNFKIHNQNDAVSSSGMLDSPPTTSSTSSSCSKILQSDENDVVCDRGILDSSTTTSLHQYLDISPPPPAAEDLSFLFNFSGAAHPQSELVDSAGGWPWQPSYPSIAGGIWFLDEVGGTVDGLMSCTESLGFESSDERRVDDGISVAGNDREKGASTANSKAKTNVEKSSKEQTKKFPPPLSSLTQDGKPTFFLRPVRKDGRLELAEVKIHRPEITLRASRQDGRLKLHLVRQEDEEQQGIESEEILEEEEEEEETIWEDEETEEFQEKSEVGNNDNGKDELEEGNNKERCFPVTNGGRDGFRRCHPVVGRRRRHDHQHGLHTWRQCLIIR